MPVDDPDMAAAIREFKGPVIETYECQACGEDYGNIRPQQCLKCGSYMIVKLVRLKNVEINNRMNCEKKTRQPEEVETPV